MNFSGLLDFICGVLSSEYVCMHMYVHVSMYVDLRERVLVPEDAMQLRKAGSGPAMRAGNRVRGKRHGVRLGCLSFRGFSLF